MKKFFAVILCLIMATAQFSIVSAAETDADWTQYEWTLDETPRGMPTALAIVQDSKGALYVSTAYSENAVWKYENGKWIDTKLSILKDAASTAGVINVNVTRMLADMDDSIYAVVAGKGYGITTERHGRI